MIRTRCVRAEDTSLYKLLLWPREKEKKFGREIRGREEKLLSAGIRLVGGEPCKKKKSRYLKGDPGERDPSLPPFFPSGRKLARALTLLSTTSKRYSLTRYTLIDYPPLLSPLFSKTALVSFPPNIPNFSPFEEEEDSSNRAQQRKKIVRVFYLYLDLDAFRCRWREKEREEMVSVKKIFMYISEVFDYIEMFERF